MNIRTRLKRGAIGAMIALMVFGAGAFADTQSTSPEVTVAVVNGQRTLSVSGAISFGSDATAGTASPFGVTVTDVAHDDVGYWVNATLTDLYRLDPAKTSTAGLDCDSSIAANNFEVSYATSSPGLSDLRATVESTLTFTGDLADADPLLLDLTGLVSTASTTITATVDTLLNSVSTTAGLMSVTDPDAALNFGTAASDGVCDTSGTAGTSILVQEGTTGEPTTSELDAMESSIFQAADSVDDEVVTAAEASNDQLLQATADDPTTGTLWLATKAAIEEWLAANPDASLLGTIDELTTDVVNNVISAAPTGLVGSVVGQSGIYANTPALVLNGTGTATTGVYRGTMTVTLTDKTS